MRAFLNSLALVLLLLPNNTLKSQIGPGNPYCTVAYTSGQCNQPGVSNATGNSINDFINDFNTCGANNDIVNNNSGCNGLANNYIYYGTTYTLITAPSQVITCNLRSGITFAQGFAIYIDWNQNNTFDLPSELVANTVAFPAAFTWTTLTFTIPSTQAIGNYRMRVRCSFVTNLPPPCGTQTYGETEDYDLVVVASNSSSILTGTATSNAPICSAQTLSLNLISSSTTPSVTWSGPNSFTSSAQNPVIPNANNNMSGVYTATIANGGCPVIKTVTVVVAPSSVFTINPLTHTICQGGSFTASATVVSNPSQLAFNWGPSGAGIFNPSLQSTFIMPPLLPSNVPLATLVYSLVVTPTVLNCPTMHTLALTINNPLTPTLTMPPTQCDNFSPVQLTAAPGGGTWSANPAVSANGLFNPGLASIGTNTVLYTVSVGTCMVSNTGAISVLKYHSAALSSSVNTRCVQDPAINLMNIVQDTTTGHWTGPNVFNDFFTSAGLATGNYSLTYQTVGTASTISNLNTCPANTILVVYVFNPPIPVIAPIAPLCNNAGTVALTASPLGGVWSGNPGVSSSGIRTPSLNFPGSNNTVMYTAGLGTCVASSTLSFHMSLFNTAALTGTIPNLCVTSSAFNLMSIVQNTNGSWSGANVTNDYFNPSGLPTNTYNVVYTSSSTPNPLLCPDSRTITASVLNPAIPGITQVGPFCNNGGTVQLVVTPSTGIWVPSSYLNANGIYTPSLSPVGDNNVQYIIGTSTCNAQQTKIIKTEAFVSAAITGNIPDLCVTSQPLNLSPFTLNNTGNWTGPGVLAGTFDPAVTGAGTHTLIHQTASSPSGLCPDVDLVAVKVYSLAAPTIKSEGPLCNNAAPIQLQVSPLGGLFGSGTSGMVSSSGFFNPALGAIGSNYVTYSIAVGPCLANSRVDISIEKFISADFENTGALAYCKNNLPFNLNSLVQNPGGVWSSSNSSAIIGEIFDPSKANIGENTIIYQMNPLGLCPHTRSISISVKDIPNVTTNISASQGCAPLEVVFNTPSTNSGKGVWNMSDGWEEKGLTVSRVFTAPGTYSVLFSYALDDAEACSTQVVTYTPITVFEAPKADFVANPEEVTISNPVVQFTNLSSVLNENKYQWTISGMATNFELNPIITFPKIGKYKITLLATSVHNCTSEIVKYMDVTNEFKIYIPNSFTPNYDGLNDLFLPVFSPYGLDTKSYEMEVYDRWGHVVFQTKDVSKGWDGTFKNSGDLIMKKDAYIYKIRYKDLDGKVYSEQGSVTLMPN
jgi:gliding motility-associated-like protein